MLKRIALLVCLCAAACALALAGVERRLTVEDALGFVDVSTPQWSPDGKWLAFTVTEWNRKDDRRDSHIYLVAAEGGEPFKLTNGERGESQPQWSPDGARLAFLANRDLPAAGAPAAPVGGRNQIWVINTRGGEAEKLTDEEAGVSQFRWSPSGKQIAYVVRDTPKDKAERDKRKREKFDAVVVDSDFTYSHLWLISLADKKKRRVTEGTFTASDPQWSPDGKWLAFVAGKTGAQESSFTDIAEDRNTDIYLVPAAGGQPRQLTTNPGPDESPRWARDGRQIAYLASDDPMSWAEKTDLLLLDVAAGKPRNLTGAYEDAVGGAPKWAPDGRTLYAPGMNGVYGQLLRVEVGAPPRPVFAGRGAYNYVDLSPDGARLAFTFNDAKATNNIWVADAAGQGARQLTFFNAQTKEFALADTEVLKWRAPDGLEIEGLLVKPVGYVAGRRYPTVLLIHGGPYGQFAFGYNRNAQLYAARGYAVLMPNPRGSTGYGHNFMTANVRDWGGKDYQDLMAGVDEVIKRGIADPDRLAVMGGSYGGFMTFWTITQTNRFKCAIGHAGISDWYGFFGQTDVPGLMEYGLGGLPWAARETYAKWSPMTYVDRVKTPLMITHGEQDRRVPIQQAELYYRALKRRGVEVVFIRYPREGHGITEPNHQIDLAQRQLDWLDKHLKSARERTAAR